jgi:hypothetical protein
VAFYEMSVDKKHFLRHTGQSRVGRKVSNYKENYNGYEKEKKRRSQRWP